MRRADPRTLGTLLLLLGSLVLLSNLKVFADLASFLRLLLWFTIGGFVWSGSRRRLPFPARLFALGVVALMAMTSTGSYAGTVALGFPALAFGLVFLADRRRWWALIPAGVLATLAMIATLAVAFPRWDAAPVLFLGLAATFTTLYLLPRGRGGQRWALYPALGAIALTVLVNDPRGNGANWFLPLVLIGSGVALLWYWQVRKPPHR